MYSFTLRALPLYFSLSVFANVSTFSQTLSVNTQIISYPNVCKNINVYKLTFSAPAGVQVSTSQGQIVNDTIFNVVPLNGLLYLTLRNVQNEQKVVEVALPTIDPILPQAPLISQQVLCADSSLPLLRAFVSTQSITANWYGSDGTLVASNTLSYQPIKDDIYFVESVYINSGCKSTSRTRVSAIRPPSICVPIAHRKHLF